MISAVVLSHNDEGIIRKTLQSILWCDEILVFDDLSTDKTVQIAKEMGAQVYIHPMNGDFASQRNFALDHAKEEWILFIDSDEIVSEELKKEITDSLKLTNNAGFYLRRRDFMFGRPLLHGETGNVKLLRLAKKGSGRWMRPVHEVWQITGEVGIFSNPLNHYPHPNVAQFLDDINTYSSLNADYLNQTGTRASLWQIVAYPTAKFFVNYIWHMGFLDGTAGAIVAIMMSFHSFLTRAKLYQIQKTATAE